MNGIMTKVVQMFEVLNQKRPPTVDMQQELADIHYARQFCKEYWLYLGCLWDAKVQCEQWNKAL